MPDSDADGTAILTLGTLAGGGSSSPPDAARSSKKSAVLAYTQA
jgi:hypothetical protein